MARKTLNNVIELGIDGQVLDSQYQGFALAALAQQAARGRIANAKGLDALAETPSWDALTDSSGGTGTAPATALAAVVLPTLTLIDGVTLMAPKTGTDTAIAALLAGQRELAAYFRGGNSVLGDLRAFLGTRTALADAGGSNNGTIDAVTVALTGSATTGLVVGTDLRDRLTKLNNNSSMLCKVINELRVAVGLTPITDNTGGAAIATADSLTLTSPAATGTALSSSDTDKFSAPEEPVETALGVLRNHLAILADGIKDVVDVGNAGPRVVATSRSRGARGRAVTAL